MMSSRGWLCTGSIDGLMAGWKNVARTLGFGFDEQR
jgi:hypothetical protein